MREVVKGGMQLPIGYRFHLTNEELIIHYLLRKAFAFPLPASVIPVFDVFFSHPRNFPGDQKEKNRYFFCWKTKDHVCNYQRNKISSCDGFWKPIGIERQIIASGKKVGIRRTLAFFETRESSNCCKTKWTMREYCLVGSAAELAKVFGMGSGEWAVYNVFERKRSTKTRISSRKSRVRDEHVRPGCIHFTLEVGDPSHDYEISPPQPSPQSSADDFAVGTVEEVQMRPAYYP